MVLELINVIGGMAISGIGTGISELTVLAAVADIVPTSMRGYYTAGVILFVAPLVPSVMYGQFIASSSTWRHIAWITGGLPVVSFFSTLIFYHPLAPAAPPDSEGRFGFLKGIDYIGGSLSLAGLALFEFALLSGGYIVRELGNPSSSLWETEADIVIRALGLTH